jgi:hypothetical protein
MKAHEDFLSWPVLETRLQVLSASLDQGDMESVKQQLQALVSGYCCHGDLPADLDSAPDEVPVSRNEVVQAR